MGEIRSTLDIIMEKTKGLTMTEEEKKDFIKKETEGKAVPAHYRSFKAGADSGPPCVKPGLRRYDRRFPPVGHNHIDVYSNRIDFSS